MVIGILLVSIFLNPVCTNENISLNVPLYFRLIKSDYICVRIVFEITDVYVQ